MHLWFKPLSRTDAQQETKGRIVPYLRFTKGNSPVNVWTWFRSTFFANATWTPGWFGKNAVEETHVNIQIDVMGHNLGTHSVLVTHDPGRASNNLTPTTYLHYPPVLLAEFRKQNLHNHRVTVQTIPNTLAYKLTIT